MRMLAAVVFLAIGSGAVGVTPEDLRRHFGEPTLERFRARPDIYVSAIYDEDHRACKITIEPADAPVLRSRNMDAEGIPKDEALRVLDEIVPAPVRGKLYNAGSFQSGCGAVSISTYENVSVATTMACDLTPKNEIFGISISFSGKTCPDFSPPSPFFPR